MLQVMHRGAILAIVTGLTLAGCGGGGGGSSTGVPTGPTPTGTARFVLTIPRAPSSLRRSPRYISPATQSASITPAGGTKTVLVLTPSNPQCVPGPSGLVCTVEGPVPVGTATVTVATYASTDGSGTPLSTASVSVTVVSGTVTTVNLVLNGVVAALSVAVSPPGLTSGVASTSSVLVNAVDAAGDTIIGPGVYADATGAPLTVNLADSDASGATHLSTAAITAPTTGITLSYNGAALGGSVTITASATGVPSASAVVSAGSAQQSIFVGAAATNCDPADPTNVIAYQLTAAGIGAKTGALLVPQTPQFMSIDRAGEIFVLVNSGNAARILKYAAGSTGSASPSASISGPASGLARAIYVAADSAGGVWAAEPPQGTSPAALEHFAPGANGTNVSPDRVITGLAGIDPALTFNAHGVAVDSHDNVYTTADQTGGSKARVYELPAASSGVVTPIASYGVLLGGASNRLRVSVDQHNDTVWVWPVDPVAMGLATPPPQVANYAFGGVAAFPPGSTAPSRVLYGNNSFPLTNQGAVNQWTYASTAFDDRGNTYVQYQVSNGSCSSQYISVFGPTQSGDVTPLQNTTIGQQTPFGIAIPVSGATAPSGSSGAPSSSITRSPSSLSFVATGSAYAQTVTFGESGYAGSWTGTSGNTAVVNVVPTAAPGAFTVTAVGAGSTTVAGRDASGNYASVPVTVSITGFNLTGRTRTPQ